MSFLPVARRRTSQSAASSSKLFSTILQPQSLESLEPRALFSAVAAYDYVSDLNPTAVTNGYGPIGIDQSNGESDAGDGRQLDLKRLRYSKGLGVHAPSDISYDLAGHYQSFISDVGIDHESGANGSANFQVYGDDVLLFNSGTLFGNGSVKRVNVDVSGVQTLRLVVTDGGDNTDDDHADWAGARLVKPQGNGPTQVGLFPQFNSDTLASKAGFPFYGMGGFTADGISADTNYAYSVDYGDGTTPDQGSAERLYFVNHTFAKPGTYTITSTVTDPAGNVGTGTNKIVVSAPVYTYASDQDTAGDSTTFTKDANSRNGKPQKINGTKYTKGIGVTGNSTLTFDVGENTDWLVGNIGIDDAAGSGGSAKFLVYTDGTLQYESGVMTGNDNFRKLRVNVRGVHQISLVTTDNADGDTNDFADWAGLRFA